MLIKKDEEPFFYKFLAIAKEIIKKNPKYTPVFYGDDERLYLACGNHAAVYDFQSNLRSQCYKFDLDKHPLDVSCQEQAAKGNVQFLVTNAKMAVSILEHCNALIMYQLKEGVQLVNRFETVFYD